MTFGLSRTCVAFAGKSQYQQKKACPMEDLDECWESLQEIAKDQLRQVLSRCILPLDLPDLRRMVSDFCDQPSPADRSELADRQSQLNNIIKIAGTSR
jgi:hypothetical protein